MNEATMTEATTEEMQAVETMASKGFVLAGLTLKKAVEVKDKFHLEFAEHVATIPNVNEAVYDIDTAIAFIDNVATSKGIDGKGKDKSYRNRLSYVKKQCLVALCDKLKIATEKEQDAWELAKYLEKVEQTLVKHKLTLRDLAEAVEARLTEAEAVEA